MMKPKLLLIKTALLIFGIHFLYQNIRAEDDIWTYTIRFKVSNGDIIKDNTASLWLGNPDSTVRGLVITTMIRNEVEFNKDPYIRQSCADMNIGMIFIYDHEEFGSYFGSALGTFRVEYGQDTVFLGILEKFAAISGKPEIQYAPWLVMGHSTAGIYVRNVAWWKPERTFGAIFYKTGGIDPEDWVDPSSSLKGIPWLCVSARLDKYSDGPTLEYGWIRQREEVLRYRKTGHLMSQLVEPVWEEGHSEWREFNGPYFAKFIKKAFRARVPQDVPIYNSEPELIEVSESSGVVTDATMATIIDEPELPDPIARFYRDIDTSASDTMYWHLDAELAIDWINYHHNEHGEFIPERDTSFTGKLRYWKPAQNIGSFDEMSAPYDVPFIYDVSETTGIISEYSAYPDESGNFDILLYDPLIKIDLDIVGDYSSIQAKQVMPFINGADAYWVHKIAAEDPQFKPDLYQILSGDVNRDGIVDDIDVEQILKRSVLKIPEFKQEWNYQGNEEPVIQERSIDWIFVDSILTRFNKETKLSSNYPNDDFVGFSRYRIPDFSTFVRAPYKPGNPYPNYKNGVIFGVMLGETDGNYIHGREPEIVEDTLILDLSKQESIGDTILLPFYISTRQNIYSIDFMVNMDQGIEVSGFSNNSPLTYEYNCKDNSISFSSFTSEGTISTGEKIGDLKLINSKADISEEDIQSVNDYLNGKKGNYKIIPTDKGSGVNNIQKNSCFIYPNPVRQTLYISFRDKNIQSLQIRVLSSDGKVLKQDHVYNGINPIPVKINDFSRGMYILEIIDNESIVRHPFLKY